MPSTSLRSLASAPPSSELLQLDTNSRVARLAAATALPQQLRTSAPLSGARGRCAAARVGVLLPPGYRDEDRIGFPTLFQL